MTSNHNHYLESLKKTSFQVQNCIVHVSSCLELSWDLYEYQSNSIKQSETNTPCNGNLTYLYIYIWYNYIIYNSFPILTDLLHFRPIYNKGIPLQSHLPPKKKKKNTKKNQGTSSHRSWSTQGHNCSSLFKAPFHPTNPKQRSPHIEHTVVFLVPLPQTTSQTLKKKMRKKKRSNKQLNKNKHIIYNHIERASIIFSIFSVFLRPFCWQSRSRLHYSTW